MSEYCHATNKDERRTGMRASYLNFQQVTLLEVVEKYLLRPGHFLIGFKATGRVRKYSVRRRAQHRGVSWQSRLSAKDAKHLLLPLTECAR